MATRRRVEQEGPQLRIKATWALLRAGHRGRVKRVSFAMTRCPRARMQVVFAGLGAVLLLQHLCPEVQLETPAQTMERAECRYVRC